MALSSEKYDPKKVVILLLCSQVTTVFPSHHCGDSGGPFSVRDLEHRSVGIKESFYSFPAQSVAPLATLVDAERTTKATPAAHDAKLRCTIADLAQACRAGYPRCL